MFSPSNDVIDRLNPEEQLALVTYLINTKFNYEQKKHLRQLLNAYTLLAESDVIYEVFSFIDFKELINLRLCSRKFNKFIMSDDYWSRVFNRYFSNQVAPQSGGIFNRFIEG